MISDYHMLSGLQKVAVLFSVVGESLAMSLIKGLSKTEVRKIRSTLRSMGTVSFNVKKRVMEEFYFGFLSEQFDNEGSDDGSPIQPFDFLMTGNSTTQSSNSFNGLSQGNYTYIVTDINGCQNTISTTLTKLS